VSRKLSATILAVVVVVSAAGVVAPGTAGADSVCYGFDSWSVQSESGDSVVNTGLEISVSGSETYEIYEADGFLNPDDRVASVSGGSTTFVSRSELKGTQELQDGSIKLYVSQAGLNCGEYRSKGTDFSFGPKTVMVIIRGGDAPDSVTEGESLDLKIAGWSTKDSLDVALKEDDPVFDDTYRTVTVSPSGSDPSSGNWEEGFFERSVTITPSDHANVGSTAEVFAAGGGVDNLGGRVPIDILENAPPEITDLGYTPDPPREGDTVHVSSTISNEPGEYYTIKWTQVSGPDVEIRDSLTDSPSFDVPDLFEDRTVELRVRATDKAGQESTETIRIPVKVRHSDPVADFDVNPSSPIVGEPITFDPSPSTDTDAGDDGVLDEAHWESGDRIDRTTEPYEESTWKYRTAGEYPVELTVVDFEGDSDTVTKTITVSNPGPDASFDVSTKSTLLGEPVSFDAAPTSDPNGDVESYTWNFGDGTTKSGERVEHSFGSTGQYDVELVVRDGNSRSTATRTITVDTDEPPSAGFDYSPSDPTAGEQVSFADESSDPDGRIVSREWTFGDGESATGSAPTHTFASGGSYDVTLTVTDDDGNSRSVTRSVSVASDEQSVVSRYDTNGEPGIQIGELNAGIDDYFVDAITIQQLNTLIDAYFRRL
jgi:PKD repeat protein